MLDWLKIILVVLLIVAVITGSLMFAAAKVGAVITLFLYGTEDLNANVHAVAVSLKWMGIMCGIWLCIFFIHGAYTLYREAEEDVFLFIQVCIYALLLFVGWIWGLTSPMRSAPETQPAHVRAPSAVNQYL